MRAGVNKFKMITLGDELSVLKCGSSQFSYLPSVVYVIGMVMILNLTAGSHNSRNSLGFFGQPGKLLLMTTLIAECLRIWMRLIDWVDIVCCTLFQDLKVGRWITTLDNEGFGRYLKPLLNYLLDSGTIKIVILTIISFVPIIVSLVLKDDHSRFRLLWVNGRRWHRSELGPERYYLTRPCRGVQENNDGEEVISRRRSTTDLTANEARKMLRFSKPRSA